MSAFCRRPSRQGTHFRCFVSGDVLEIMEQRHDWSKLVFTTELFKYVFLVFLPEVISHSQTQDEEQVRGHYDRTFS